MLMVQNYLSDFRSAQII